MAASSLDWYKRLSYDVSRSSREAVQNATHQKEIGTICQYLANAETEKIGLRAYSKNHHNPIYESKSTHLNLLIALNHFLVEYALPFHYGSLFRNWALAKEFKTLGERTYTVCYEDLTNNFDSAWRAVNDMHLFFFHNRSQTSKIVFQDGDKLKALLNYKGGHSTSHDNNLRQHLVEVIQKIDREHYDGDIAWLTNVLPC